MIAVVAILVLLIGVSLGVSGIGGFLIPPLLVVTLGLGSRDAVATALISFIPSGLIGTFLYQRRDRFSGRLALALSSGTLPGVLVGRQISLSTGEVTLERTLAAALMIGAAFLVRKPRLRPPSAQRSATTAPRFLVVALIGCGAGVLTVLAGVGGPLIAVPALILLGVDVAAAVGAALLSSVVGSSFGALALLPVVQVDPGVLALTSVPQVVGVVAGVMLRSRIPSSRLPLLIAAAAVVTAVWIVVRTLR